jgi:ATP-dependent RNA helicase RhlE
VATTVDTVTQRVIHVENRDKRSLLVKLFADAAMSRALVFTRTKRGQTALPATSRPRVFR